MPHPMFAQLHKYSGSNTCLYVYLCYIQKKIYKIFLILVEPWNKTIHRIQCHIRGPAQNLMKNDQVRKPIKILEK